MLIINSINNALDAIEYNELHTAVTELERALSAIDCDDWQPIDYSQADSGKGCFDGSLWLLEVVDNDRRVEKRVITTGRWDNHFTWWREGYGGTAIMRKNVKHYRPIPQGWLKGG